MRGCQKYLNHVGVCLVLLCLLTVLVCHISLRRSLVVYLEKLSFDMTVQEVRSIVPNRFFVQEGIATNSYYLLDRIFQDNVLAHRFLAYSQVQGERFADAQIFFDQNNIIIGFSYEADGFYQLSSPRNDADGLEGPRIRVFGAR